MNSFSYNCFVAAVKGVVSDTIDENGNSFRRRIWEQLDDDGERWNVSRREGEIRLSSPVWNDSRVSMNGDASVRMMAWAFVVFVLFWQIMFTFVNMFRNCEKFLGSPVDLIVFEKVPGILMGLMIPQSSSISWSS